MLRRGMDGGRKVLPGRRLPRWKGVRAEPLLRELVPSGLHLLQGRMQGRGEMEVLRRAVVPKGVVLRRRGLPGAAGMLAGHASVP